MNKENEAMNLKRILLATDGSEYSAGAQRLAFALARQCNAELTAMTIVLGVQDLEGVGTHHLRESLEKDARVRLDLVTAAAGEAGLACATRLAFGEKPEVEIVDMAAELDADLIVLGRRGKRGLARFMVGHATAWVAGHAGCPVLVVPRAAAMWKSRILLATDGSAHSAAAAEAAKGMARQCNLPVTAVSAFLQSHSEERRAEARAAAERTAADLTAAGAPCDAVASLGRPDEVVIETAAARGADLLVVGSHGRTGLVRLVLGSVSERIMGQATCPVLVARAAV